MARRTGWVVLGAVAVVVVVAGLALGWAATRPSTTKLCTAAGAIDGVGGATPEAARTRWAAEQGLDIDGERPDRTSGSGDRVTATYVLDGPAHGPIDPDRSRVREVVTERSDDGVWRVVSANECEEWTDA